MNLHLMSSAPFEKSVSVMPEDIDEQNHVNNTVYLRWVQEVATAHWKAIASRETQKGIGWIVLRHEIDYKAPACLGDGPTPSSGICRKGSIRRRRYLQNPSPSPLRFEGRADVFLSRCLAVGRFNAKRLPFPVEYSTRVTPGYRLLLRNVSQTGDAAYLPANHRSETMRSGGDCAETRKCRALSI